MCLSGEHKGKVKSLLLLLLTLVTILVAVFMWIWAIEREKIEYSVLQKFQSEVGLAPAETFRLIKSEDMDVLIVRSRSSGTVAILLNPKRSPYCKKIPGRKDFLLSQYDLEKIKKSVAVHEKVLEFLELKVSD